MYFVLFLSHLYLDKMECYNCNYINNNKKRKREHENEDYFIQKNKPKKNQK